MNKEGTEMSHEQQAQGQPESAAPETAGEPVVETAPELTELAKLRQDNADLREALLRRQADFDNARKRLRREADEAGSRALARFVKPLLMELDNFQRALEVAKPETFADFALGVTMIKTNLDTLLGSNNIVPVSTEGVFDPQLHEVLQEVERADLPRGTIVAVQRQGWKLGEQLIRAAQVVVARPPAQPAPAG